jgi:hypothetical protein
VFAVGPPRSRLCAFCGEAETREDAHERALAGSRARGRSAGAVGRAAGGVGGEAIVARQTRSLARGGDERVQDAER